MPYHRVYIGDGEFTIARVPREVVDEWLLLRERNKQIGYPDRPPDVDTPLLRTWILHPGDTLYDEEEKRLKASGITETVYPVYSISIRFAANPLESKFMINWSSTEGYVYRLVTREERSGNTLADQTITSEEWNEEAFQQGLELFAHLFVEDNPNPPMISTYFDFLVAEEETELARKEMREYYGTVN